MHTKSENRIRGRQPMAIYAMHDAQRTKVTNLLTAHIVKPPDIVSGELNRFVVTLCRISAGELDEEDNLRGALKHVKDAIARWLGFRNDNDKRLAWKYQQQQCPRKYHAVRVTIDDMAEGDERTIETGKDIPALGRIIEGSVGGEKRAGLNKPERVAPKAVQQGLAFRRAFIARPWDVPVGAAEDDIIVTELHKLGRVENPPKQFQVVIPTAHVDVMLRRYGLAVKGLGPGPGPRLVFERLDHEDEALGGKCWLYMPVELDGPTKI